MRAAMQDHDRLFEELALAFRAGEEAPFFLGDNLDGYYEGVAFREAGAAGYVVRGHAFFRDFTSWRDDLENLRDKADGARLHPYGIRHTFGPFVWDELVILRQRRAIALRVHCDRPRPLTLGPLFALRGAEVRFETRGSILLMSLENRPLHVAFASPQPFAFAGRQARHGCLQPLLRTAQAESEFTLYVCFSSDPARAVDQAERLRSGDAVLQHKRWVAEFLMRSSLWTSDEDYNKALAWAKLTTHFLVTEDPGRGIWAGLPWFRENWGRDTFIALPGALLATGQFEEAREVFRQFIRWQNRDPGSPDHGRIPNRVRGPDDLIYNTADGTLWFIREVHSLLQHTGDLAFATEVYPSIKLALDAATKRHVDKEGFLTHGDADTWMDARIDGEVPWSPRGNRACEIQALWHEALLIGIRLATLAKDRTAANRWQKSAALVARNFPRRFWNPRKKLLADRLAPDGTPDYSIRPNALLVLSVPGMQPLLEPGTAATLLRRTCETLLFPHGVASLDPADERFHPFHDNRPEYHKDAAYHNGTIWGWNAGFAITALVRHGQIERAAELASHLTGQILRLGHRGTMSELLDAWPGARGRPTPSGTWAQAWSTSEFVRNAAQDFCGFQPRLLDGLVVLRPRMPPSWSRCSATFPFGRQERVLFNAVREKDRDVFLVKLEGPHPPARFDLEIESLGRTFTLSWEPKPADTYTVVVDRRGAMIGTNGQWAGSLVRGEPLKKAGKPIHGASLPKAPPQCATLAHPDHLRALLLPPSRRTAAARTVKRPAVKRRARH